jgi:rhomboid protease GluP
VTDQPDESRKYAWIDRVVKLAELFGANPVSVRWRLMRWQDRRESEREAQRVAAQHVTYAHAVCPECGRVAPRGTQECGGCGARMGSRAGQVLRRSGFLSPVGVSASIGLGALILIAYAKQVVATDGGFMSFGSAPLVLLGAHVPALERQGEWWRLGTAIFLHGGLLHLAFNLMALTQIGPVIEEVFGRGRAVFLFMATGLLAFLPGALMGSMRPSIGASGAIMGFIGVAAGWGHRDGTSIGINVRNQMLKWLGITTLLGLVLPVDHLAHFGGFLAGAAFGYLSRPRRRGKPGGALGVALGVAGSALAIACVAVIWTR